VWGIWEDPVLPKKGNWSSWERDWSDLTPIGPKSVYFWEFKMFSIWAHTEFSCQMLKLKGTLHVLKLCHLWCYGNILVPLSFGIRAGSFLLEKLLCSRLWSNTTIKLSNRIANKAFDQCQFEPSSKHLDFWFCYCKHQWS
jgi:hypothetical protein